MQIKIEDIHNAHGLSFVLVIEPDNNSDKESFETLRELLNRIAGDKNLALYSYKIRTSVNRLSIGFADQVKQLAKVDHLWSDREDQKFVVLVIEGDEENFPYGRHGYVPHFKCHWCHKETWGVDRYATEVYDPKYKRTRLVNVHCECQEKREKQIASIPFEA